jgi:hypothetical protein
VPFVSDPADYTSLKPIEEFQNVPHLEGSLMERCESLAEGLSRGELSIDRVVSLTNLVSTTARIKEIDELESRIVKLESSLAN